MAGDPGGGDAESPPRVEPGAPSPPPPSGPPVSGAPPPVQDAPEAAGDPEPEPPAESEPETPDPPDAAEPEAIEPPPTAYPGLGMPPAWGPGRSAGPSWGYGPPWQSPPRRSGIPGWVIVAVAMAVVGVLIVGVGVVAAVNGGGSSSSDRPSGRPEDPEDLNGWDRPSEEATHGVATDGRAACTTGGRELFCVDAATGDDLFSEQLPDAGTPPAIVGETVVVAADGGSAGDVHGYSLDGELLWDTPDIEDVDLDGAELGIASGLPVAGEVVAVAEGEPGDTTTELVGIDTSSGEEAWRASGAGGLPPIGPPASDGERFYVTTVSFTMDVSVEPTWVVAAIDGSSGSEVWRFDVGVETGFVESAVTVADGTAVALRIVGETQRVVVVDAATGELLWEAPLATGRASVAHVDGVTVVADGVALRGYDDEGTELWSVAALGGDDPPDASSGGFDLVVLDGRLFAYRLDVHEIDPTDGSSRQLEHMILANGLAVAADHLIVAGEGLRGFLLPD